MVKKTEIATRVFEVTDSLPLAEISGGVLSVPLADIAGISVVPWFCDTSVQWAIRISIPGKVLKKTLLRKVSNAFASGNGNGAVLVGVPGDGIRPSTYTLAPLAEAIAAAVQPDMTLELATANLGVVKRDWDARAETSGICGNQRYVGSVDSAGNWLIQSSAPTVSRATLEVALACGRMVVQNGPWKTADKSEARAALIHWLTSPQANINPAAVKQLMVFRDGEYSPPDERMVQRLCGLGLGFFRHRLAEGPYRWEDAGPQRHAPEVVEDVVQSLVG